MLTQAQFDRYSRDGFLIVPGFLDAEETALLNAAARADAGIRENTLSRSDGEGGDTKLSLWSDASDDFLGLLSRSDRLVDSAQALLGEEPYLWHTKVIQKEARTGGAWAWHQDYGYWYNDHVLFPRLLSCFIAIDPATRENGCMQVLRGSHHIGRINHGAVGGQTGADPARVDAACAKLELVYCEMGPGDALFFDCNLLHRSDQNRSPNPRWAIICCYNAASNSPIAETWQPSYKPIAKVPHTMLKEAGRDTSSTLRQYLKR